MRPAMNGNARTIAARAPLRISFAGGGTDLPAYYERHEGMVVSTTIDKYVHVQCTPNGRWKTRDAQITSADFHTFYRHHCGTPMKWEGDLALPRAVLHSFGVESDTSLFVSSEVPPGTGLGSSSAVAVALVGALSEHLNWYLSRRHVAELACQVELDKLHAPIGKQDQYASAFGGLNAITFRRDEIRVERLKLPPGTARQLDQRLILFFTGTARDSASILRRQRQASEQNRSQTVDGLRRMYEAAVACRKCLEAGDLDGIGHLLDDGWRLKRSLVSGISNPVIDDLYDTARANGAIGGKITGAGGGGFMLLYCHEDRQEELTNALEKKGLRRMDFHFEDLGVCVATINWQSVAHGGRPARLPIAFEDEEYAPRYAVGA